MEVRIERSVAEAKAFRDDQVDWACVAGVDGELFAMDSIAALAAMPALTEGGTRVQDDGTALLRGFFDKACQEKEIDPGDRFSFGYATAEFEGEVVELKFKLPYQHGGRTFLPSWRRQSIEQPKGGGKGKAKEGYEPPRLEWKDWVAPYIGHGRRMITAEIQDGVIQLNNPDLPMKVQDYFWGLTDDRRPANIRLDPAADHKELCGYGFHVDQAGYGRWREAMKAQVGAHAHLEEVYCTTGKGWVRFPGCASPHYVYGDRVVAPPDSPELRAISRGGSGPAAPMGVSTQGTMAEWRSAMSLILRNPDMASLLGFSASSALLARIKEMEAGIIHLVGGSSKGKSTALKVAASLIGSAEGPREATAYVQSWNSTENAMEAPLEARSDSPSLYDELYELPQNVDILALLYRVTNGRGKQRMTRDIEARLVKVWKTQILSTGEGSFASRIAQDGHEFFPGGLQFRVMELHIETIPFWSHVAAEGAKPDHGAYRWLVEGERASAPTPQARIIESIELTLKKNHGHFWERWIGMLQTQAGAALAEQWFEQERGALEALIPAGANPVYVRRSKHVAAAMAGLRGILSVCEFPPAESVEILEAARAWARDHLWGAGLSVMGGEATDLSERFRDWLLARESEFHRLGQPFGPGRPSIGWIDHAGGCAVPGAELRKIAVELRIDCGRLETAMRANGWEKTRKRHPSSGRESAALHVWFAVDFFRGTDKHGRPETAEEVWGGQ